MPVSNWQAWEAGARAVGRTLPSDSERAERGVGRSCAERGGGVEPSGPERGVEASVELSSVAERGGVDPSRPGRDASRCFEPSTAERGADRSGGLASGKGGVWRSSGSSWERTEGVEGSDELECGDLKTAIESAGVAVAAVVEDEGGVVCGFCDC